MGYVKLELVHAQHFLPVFVSNQNAVPNDAKLAEEIARVEKAKKSAVDSQAVSNPSKECLDICAKSKPARSGNDKECVVTCITTLRTMSYKMAKMFL